MKDLTVIVPIHKMDEKIASLLERAIKSLKEADKEGESKVIFIAPEKADFKLPNFELKNDNKFLAISKSADFSTQINTAVKECDTKYFTILEVDDEFTPTWFKNVEKQIEVGEDISLYLPLTEVIDSRDENKGPIGYVNEAVWASSFSEVIGELDLECLLAYLNFNTTGGVFKKDDFVSVGGLKPSMKLTFWYEFLLRLLNSGKRVYVIPKVGYHHYIYRDGSLSDTYNKEMTTEEGDWWVELAKKEYFFKKDRKKTYEE